jgi:FemAB-related protein (PEP-CTERM system-associated)
MQIRMFSDEFDLWTEYVRKHPQATFYHEIGWKEIIERSFGHKTYYLMAMRQDSIAGILPLVHLKSHLFGSIYCSMPFLNFGGICADDSESERDLLDAARELLRKTRADYLELRHRHNSCQDLPAKTHKVSMMIELDSDPEKLWNGFKTKHRTNIRRSEKNGLTLRSGGAELVDDFFNIISFGWRDLGTPLYRKSFFQAIVDRFSNNVEIFVVYHKDMPIGTAFNGLFRDTVEGMWTYALKENSNLQTNYFLYWKMIEKACMDGYRHFHLGRSTNETGATFFKSKWNAVPQQLYWEYILNRKKAMPDLSVDNPRFRLAQNVWRRMPVSLTNFIGPWVARSIP